MSAQRSQAVKRLRGLLEREIASPGSVDDALDSLSEVSPDLEPFARFLKLKDQQHRSAFYVKSEHVWYRRLGWRLMRPLFVLGIIAAVVFSLTFRGRAGLDPTVATALFLGGAASFYVVLQVFIHRWAQQNVKKLDGISADYRRRLRELLAELGEQ